MGGGIVVGWACSERPANTLLVPEQRLTHLITHFTDAFPPLLAFNSRTKPIITLKQLNPKLHTIL